MDKKQLQERYAEFQRATKYPSDKYHENFTEWFNKAIRYASPAVIKMSVTEFIEISNKQKEDLTLWDLGAVFHIMEIRTAADLEMSMSEYCDYMTAVSDMIKIWRDIVGPKQEALNREFEAKQRMEQENSGRTIEMSPIVAEA